MGKSPSISEEAMGRLAQYWFRANLMHDFLHELMAEFDDDVTKVDRGGHWFELETYMSYWLSGLFVVVEGFNKLGIEDDRVKALFKKELPYLKGMRHDTYHFTLDKTRGSQMLQHLNWAEELHQAISEHIRTYTRNTLKRQRRAKKSKIQQ